MQRHDGRAADQLRVLKIQRGFVRTAQASVLIEAGNTMVLCTASVEKGVPPWRRPRDPAAAVQGWVTGEYSMLPGSTSPRKQRERSKVDGRTTEIQRLIGRSLRAVVDFAALGDHTITVDCDVLQADGGTRTTSITGGYIAARGCRVSCVSRRVGNWWPADSAGFRGSDQCGGCEWGCCAGSGLFRGQHSGKWI